MSEKIELNTGTAKPVENETVLQEAQPESTYLNISLYPHRSLSRKGTKYLFGVIGLIGLFASLRFLVIGAWPVVFFILFDIAAVALAFYLSFRSGRLFEIVRLTDKSLTVTRIQPNGQSKSWSFEPMWLRVDVKEWHGEKDQLVLSSHGKHLILADFVIPTERREIAKKIEDALGKWRNTRHTR